MADFQVTIKIINGVYTPEPHLIPPPGGQIHRDNTVTFDNKTGNQVSLNFNGPNGTPFVTEPNPLLVPVAGTAPKVTVFVPIGTKKSYSYLATGPGPGGVTAADGDGSGIIIVDGGGGMPKPNPKKASAKPAAKSPKIKPKAKPKTTSKAKPKSKGKATGGKKPAPKRKAGKGRSKKK